MVEHRLAQDAHWVQDHIRPIVERGSTPFIWTEELAEVEVPIRADCSDGDEHRSSC